MDLLPGAKPAQNALNHTIEVAHANGAKVYAWMTILSLDCVLEEHPEWSVIAYDYDTGECIVGPGYIIEQVLLCQNSSTTPRTFTVIWLDIINAGPSSVALDYVTVNGVMFTNVTFTPSTLQPGSLGEVYIQ